MKASELVELLQKLIEVHGDLPVCLIEEHPQVQVFHEPVESCYRVSLEHSEYFLIE